MFRILFSKASSSGFSISWWWVKIWERYVSFLTNFASQKSQLILRNKINSHLEVWKFFIFKLTWFFYEPTECDGWGVTWGNIFDHSSRNYMQNLSATDESCDGLQAIPPYRNSCCSQAYNEILVYRGRRDGSSKLSESWTVSSRIRMKIRVRPNLNEQTACAPWVA